MSRTSIHGEWSSRTAFILAATGSAVGLGNIWKFPYMAGQYGGGAFVITYLLCIAIICLPVMMAEVMLGKLGRSSPINTMYHLAVENKQSKIWILLGWSGAIAGFLILSYYSVIAGWALAYVPELALGTFTKVENMPTAEISPFVDSIFNSLTENPTKLIFWHTSFICMTMFMIAGGVKGGLERAVTFMMPALFILLLVLVGYSMSTPDFMRGFQFMFNVNFDNLLYPNCTEQACELSGDGLLAAMGQAFFSLSLGMGSIMVYGAYLPKNASVSKVTTAVVLADTSVAILAGLIIFPIVFSNGLEPGAGVGLVFKTLPIAFGQMPFGTLFGTLFFILLVLAALSSSISLIEPAVAWLVETKKFTRISASVLSGIFVWLVGLITVFSFNLWSEVKPIGGLNLFELIDYLTANIMLPLAGLLIAIFTGWLMKKTIVANELNSSVDSFSYRIWYFLLRYVTPLGVSIVFLNAIGVFS
ncbi:sodium-dependent transporter [Thiotrichales bacterium HSG1]|nr:sodium-dependent transporter [Thiotrichales bacterium HSG1]